jgi:hypothetical protein
VRLGQIGVIPLPRIQRRCGRDRSRRNAAVPTGDGATTGLPLKRLLEDVPFGVELSVTTVPWSWLHSEGGRVLLDRGVSDTLAVTE